VENSTHLGAETSQRPSSGMRASEIAYPNAHRVRTQKGDRRGLVQHELIYHNVRHERNLLDRDRNRDAKKRRQTTRANLRHSELVSLDLG